MRTILATLGTLWALPMTLLHAVVTGALVALGLLRFGWRDQYVFLFFPRFERQDALGRWWGDRWRLWDGSCPGTAIVWIQGTMVVGRLLEEEKAHSRQGRWLGPFFLPVYLALHLLYGYDRNPLEVAARRAAWRASISRNEARP